MNFSSIVSISWDLWLVVTIIFLCKSLSWNAAKEHFKNCYTLEIGLQNANYISCAYITFTYTMGANTVWEKHKYLSIFRKLNTNVFFKLPKWKVKE